MSHDQEWHKLNGCCIKNSLSSAKSSKLKHLQISRTYCVPSIQIQNSASCNMLILILPPTPNKGKTLHIYITSIKQ